MMTFRPSEPFFANEAALHKDGRRVDEKPFQVAYELTPKRRHKEAMEAARPLATPEPWSKRSRKE